MVARMAQKKLLATDRATGLQHNASLTRAMRARGFRPEHMGGTQSAYLKREELAGEVVVTTGDGWLPVRATERVLVSTFGAGNNLIMEQEFASLRAFLKTLRTQR